MTGSLVFPTRLFAPSSLAVGVSGSAISGGASLSGEAQSVEVGGGGRIVAQFGQTDMFTREKVLAWRRFATGADNGATPILVPFADRRHQPVHNPYAGTDTFGLDTWVADATAWTAEEVTAIVSADAALGATSISFALTAPLKLLGGEFFARLHATYGWRAYETLRVVSGGTVGSGVATTVQFRPPLREAIASGAALNFESPRCVMKIDGDVTPDVQLLRFGKASARFVEYPGPPA